MVQPRAEAASIFAVFENTMASAAMIMGKPVGLGKLKHLLRRGDKIELARRLDALARGRRSAAHPDVSLPDAIAEALKCEIGKGENLSDFGKGEGLIESSEIGKGEGSSEIGEGENLIESSEIGKCEGLSEIGEGENESLNASEYVSIDFTFDGVDCSARVMCSAGRVQSNGMTHKIQYTAGCSGYEWVRLDEQNLLMSDCYGHFDIPYERSVSEWVHGKGSECESEDEDAAG
jgi:hypothetical protein